MINPAAMSFTKPFYLLLAAVGITACGQRPCGLSDAEQPILDRILQVRELRVAAAEQWPGFDDPQYDTPLLYLTDSVCYAVNPEEPFRAQHDARLVCRTAECAIYKTTLPDSQPFHMETQYDFGDTMAYNHRIPYLFCSSPEITRSVETSVTDDTYWLPMVLHEYAHGFQLQQPGYLEAFREAIVDVPEMEMAALHKQYDWLDKAVRAENRALLEALDADGGAERDACVARFRGLREARKQRMAAELGDSVVRTEAVYEAMEGMARFVEAQAGIALGSYSEADAWLFDTDSAGYFFATGYNLIRLLDRCGANKSQLFTGHIRPLEDFLTTSVNQR